MLILNSKVAQFARLLDTTGIPGLIDAELAGRPGPPGLPIRTVLVGLMLAVHYTGKATIAEARRLLTFSLTPTAQALLNLDGIGDDERAHLASSRRFYRAFDRLTSLTDPARADRRRRLPQAQATLLAAAWEDGVPKHLRRRTLLQTIATALVLAPVRRAHTRGHPRHWNGDVGIDTTAVPVLRGSRTSQSLNRQPPPPTARTEPLGENARTVAPPSWRTWPNHAAWWLSCTSRTQRISLTTGPSHRVATPRRGDEDLVLAAYAGLRAVLRPLAGAMRTPE